MENKIKRFIELSKEFTVKSSEAYGDFNPYVGNITINGGCGTYYTINSEEQSKKQPTKLEQFEIAQKEKIEKAKRYEEYLELQSSLSEYYTVLEKLNK